MWLASFSVCITLVTVEAFVGVFKMNQENVYLVDLMLWSQ